MTTSQLPPRKAVRLSARYSASGARLNAAFTTQQPHRSSTTHRPADQKDPSHLTGYAIATAHSIAAATLAVARPRPNPHS
jgi:hypothetical protein